MDVRDKMEIEIDFELDKIGTKIEVGSDEHKKAVDDVAKLTDKLIELKRVDNEREKIELDRAKMEADKSKADVEQQRVDLEREKMVEDRKGRFVQNIINAAGIVVPAGITIAGMVMMFLFEENGTITGGASRKVVDRMFRQK